MFGALGFSFGCGLICGCIDCCLSLLRLCVSLCGWLCGWLVLGVVFGVCGVCVCDFVLVFRCLLVFGGVVVTCWLVGDLLLWVYCCCYDLRWVVYLGAGCFVFVVCGCLF